jgi:hypothetical protein
MQDFRNRCGAGAVKVFTVRMTSKCMSNCGCQGHHMFDDSSPLHGMGLVVHFIWCVLVGRSLSCSFCWLSGAAISLRPCPCDCVSSVHVTYACVICRVPDDVI